MDKTFVLVHGTWHGGWAWKDVIRYLFGKGHRAYAPTLAGHGPGATRVGITHRDCVASVVTYIEEHQLEGVVAVGTVFGGTVVQKVVEELSGRIARTVFLDALILKDIQCVFDLLPDVFPESLKPKNGNHPAAATSGETTDTLATAPWETWHHNFMQDSTFCAYFKLPESLQPAIPKRCTFSRSFSQSDHSSLNREGQKEW